MLFFWGGLWVSETRGIGVEIEIGIEIEIEIEIDGQRDSAWNGRFHMSATPSPHNPRAPTCR